MPSRRVRVGSPTHTRAVLRDYHRAWVAAQLAKQEEDADAIRA